MTQSNTKKKKGSSATDNRGSAAPPGDGNVSNNDTKEEDWKEQLMALFHKHKNNNIRWEEMKIPAAVVLLAIVVTGHTKTFFVHLIYPIYWLCLRVIAVALGVALGLGFATHVYDQLEIWAGQKRVAEQRSYEDGVVGGRRSSRKEETQAMLMDHLRGSNAPGAAVGGGKQFMKVAPSGGTNSKIDPGASNYVALMASAGYEVDANRQRGQVLKEPLPPAYPWCYAPLDQQYALSVMGQEWPTLPPPIIKALGRFMEFVMRDYVSTWYSMMDMDQGILYPDCVQRAKDKAACEERGDVWVEPPPKPPPKPHQFPRWMIFTTGPTRTLPLVENIYRSMAIIFGNLSHRVQDVNAFRLVLLKWTKVIAHTFRVYRELRKALTDKQSVKKIALFEEARGGVGRSIMRRTVNSVKASVTSQGSIGATTVAEGGLENAEEGTEGAEGAPSAPAAFQPVSEMAMTREFLVTGKLHPACTFGLEIPSLLFADPTGKDCGTGGDNDDDNINSDDGSSKKKDEDQVLEERLYKTKLLSGCELDYNRVLSSRIIKLLIPRQDFGSPLVATLMTEIMAGCVLTPTMSCFSPDYLNDWIKKGMDAAEEGEDANTTTAAESSTRSRDSPQVMRSWEDDGEEIKDGSNNHPSTPRVRTFSEEDGEMILEDCFDKEGREELGELMDLSANELGDISALNKEAAEDLLESMTGASENEPAIQEDPDESDEEEEDEEEEEGEGDEDDGMAGVETVNTATSGVHGMVSLLDDALMTLQSCANLDDANEDGVEINWDDPSCKEAILRLVLVVESMLFHGRRKTPVPIAGKKSDAGSGGDGEQPNETVEEEFHAGNLTQILMELTSDIDAFEQLHVSVEDKDGDYTEPEVSVDENDESDQDYEPTMSDLSTLRTLIAAWLHTGQVYRAVSTLSHARRTVLRPFYHSRAFLRNSQTAGAMSRKLRQLDGIDVMVDTVAILNSEKLDPVYEMEALSQRIEAQETAIAIDSNAESKGEEAEAASPTKKRGFKGLLDKGAQNLKEKKKALGNNLNDKKKAIGENLNSKKKAIGQKVNKDILRGSSKGRNTMSNSTVSDSSAIGTQSETLPNPQPRSNLPASMPASSAPTNFSQMQMRRTPRYLEYHRNEAFASSLRSERDRRMQSWVTSIQNDTEMLQIVCRLNGTPEDIAYHRELHHVARIFYAGTNMIGIRDAARSSGASQRQRLNTADSVQSICSTSSIGSEAQSPEVSLLTVEMACARRRIEVPDDDSSFLLRAQPRPLNSMGVHRDTRNADLSYRSFAGSYEEPAILPGSNRYSGGRFVRRCQIRYYPSNRTASVVVLNDARKLDQRKGKMITPETPRGKNQSVTQGSVSFLSPEFTRERHLCQKCIPKGSTSRSQPGMLSSTVMEQADFTAAPRTGRALDFVYRMSLFESPMVDLGSKRFTVHDSSSQSSHRADASSLEMSDAALSAALLVIGRDFTGSEINNSSADDGSVASTRSHVRNRVEFGPDGFPIIWLKYSKKLPDGTTSTEIKPLRTSFVRASLLVTATRQEAQLQCLIKCVKAGSAKSATKARTDAQLRPTLRLLDFARDRSRDKQEKLMRDLKLGINHISHEQLRRNALVSPRYPTVIQSLQVSVESAMPAKDANVNIPGNPQGTVFKIKCIATIALVDEEISEEALRPYLTGERKQAATYKETWVIFRQFKEFQALHKHLKSQVAAAESSGTAGSRLVGAAAAAFTAGVSVQPNRSRHRGAMIPSLGQASKTGALGVTQRSATKRMETLDGYLQHLLREGNPLSRCPELLMFIGAFYPLAPEVLVGKLPISPLNDPLGRAEMSREVLQLAVPEKPKSRETSSEANTSDDRAISRREATTRTSAGASFAESQGENQKPNPNSERVIMTNQAIVNKIDQVSLGQVRSRIFELLSFQFGFENASFFRSRMLSALKTMSFAITTPGEFRKTLYKTHIEQISAEAIAYWIGFGTDTLWPDGVFFESKPPLTPEQQEAASNKTRELLHSGFPDQLRTVLGGDLASDGLDILHELLQNRMVVKSLFYSLFDLLWEEVFPEMKDVLAGPEYLGINFDDEE